MAIEKATNVKRQTMGKWFGNRGEPDLATMARIADYLELSRADLIAAFDGTDLSPYLPEPSVITDPERRRRRTWWLYVARRTAHLGVEDARDALGGLGRSGRGNLVTLWEDPRSRLEPSEAQIRALAEIYRIPVREWVQLWNNPPPTDEEEIAALRGVRIEEVPAPAAESPSERPRKQAS